MSSHQSAFERARTKIVATVGPACSRPDQLTQLVQAGVNIFRLNMAHGSLGQHAELIDAIRAVSKELGTPVAILVDLAGPKIRLGELTSGEIECHEGEEFRFIRGDVASDSNELVSNYEKLVDELVVGNRVMLADGTVSMKVEERTATFARCKVMQPGIIRSRQGINLPGAKLSVPGMTKRDCQHAVWAAEAGVDFVSLSFVRTAEDVHALQTMLRACGSQAKVIAKIEKPEALDKLEEIVRVSDGIMVARGDLGVEIDIARVPLAQKRIISMCNTMQKPVITATQMLDSMQHSRYPTRAEATDVANAILDGTDACMLSGETAIGKYPQQTVETMGRIALEAEQLFRDRPPQLVPFESDYLHSVTPAVLNGAGHMARQLKAKLIAVASHSGATALAVSKQRNFAPTIGVSDSPSTLRLMCLYWGVIPLAGAPTHDVAELMGHVEDWGLANGTLSSGDRVVVVTGSHLTVGGHNLLTVHEIT